MRFLSTFGEVNEFSFWRDIKRWGLWKDCDKQISKGGSPRFLPFGVHALCNPIPLSVINIDT